MKNDEKILEMVKDLRADCMIFIDSVKAYGNQCAYTDRMLEKILETSGELEKLYSGNFTSSEGDQVYWVIIYNEKGYKEERALHYDDYDDARADFIYFSEREPEFYNYLVLKEITYHENDGSETYKDLEYWGIDEKEVK